MTATHPAPTWEPGDPLHDRAASHSGASYRHYLFNFRYDSDGEHCSCGDAASWPEPRNGQNLGNRDELGEFIDDVRQDDDRRARGGRVPIFL
jgi:hypothetical protein